MAAISRQRSMYAGASSGIRLRDVNTSDVIVTNGVARWLSITAAQACRRGNRRRLMPAGVIGNGGGGVA